MVTAIEQLDKTAELSLVSGDGSDVKSTRYLFMAGDIIPPERKDRLAGGLEHLAAGGAEVEARCLRRTTNYIPRCVLTPLELWINPMPKEFLPDGFPQELLLQVKGTGDGSDAPIGSARMLQGRTLVGYPVYPGQDAASILTERTGIVEVPSLLGVEWSTGEPQRIQKEFFHDGAPYELSKLQSKISQRAPISFEAANSMITSCDTFRRWAEWRLRVEHTLLQQRVSQNGQMVFTYSQLAPQLLQQLEMTPQDQGFQHMMAQSQNIIAEAIRGMGGTSQQASVSPEMIATIVKAVMEATAPPKTIEEVKKEKKVTPRKVEKDGNSE